MVRLVFLFALLCTALTARADRGQSSWYVDTFGAAKATAATQRAHEIFTQLKRTTGQQASETNLLVINSNDRPWAVALPDGNIVLSKGGLDVIYQGGTSTHGDAQLAFILGHELAHHLNRDFEHGAIRRHLAGEQSLSSRSAQELKASHERELLADQTGFEYAALTGYSVDEILTSTVEDKSFIEFWVQQTGSDQGQSHPEADYRSARLREHLQSISERVAIFNFGVRLAHFGRYADAKDILIDFQKTFSSSQVLNNLGYVYLQLARRKLPQQIAYRYWFPTLLDAHSGLRRTVRGNNKDIPPEALKNLNKAVDKFDRACQMDLGSITCRINLTASLLYLGKFGTARDTIEEALSLDPDDVRLLALRALILNELEPDIDMWAIAKSKLEPLATTPDADPSTVFNFARLLQERGRDGAALPFWQRLADHLAELPSAYQYEVCTALNATQLCDNDDKQHHVSPWTTVIGFGSDVDTQTTRQQLTSWKRTEDYSIGPGLVTVFTSPYGDSILALDSIAELAVLKTHEIQSVSALISRYGAPRRQTELVAGSIYSYGSGWSAYVVNDRVEEIWLSGL